tara:strand:- start:903 stop:1010 length:108 start_codon:yes stop_codon:yes gene_type:complete
MIENSSKKAIGFEILSLRFGIVSKEKVIRESTIYV